MIEEIAVGYPDEAPPRRPRKALEEIVEYRW
jgi:nitroreductase